ncbi:MAG: hypothetical protein DHS20C17_16360 [Cyclobacteriaceae bacterium]|nr:MAG: hypothetical protein DHS20C17_16360 [Cyclobacteriaceae bacterium]
MRFVYYVLTIGVIFSCTPEKEKITAPIEEIPEKASFISSLASDSANLWWARTLVDVDGDGILDVALHDNNGYGGWLGYLKGRIDGELWETVIVAMESPNGKKFAAGDLDAGDIDGDGDNDLIGVEHPGEWEDAEADAVLFWYEQSENGWITHNVGSIPSALKDISLSDLNGDGLPEIITVTYNAETLTIFNRDKDKLDFKKIWETKLDNLHEGMDVGDVNGDGAVDIAANGYLLVNQGGDLTSWETQVIDSMWFNQEEDHWARNATKHVCKDVDGDGQAEVFISHSEKTSYPVARYDLNADGSWNKQILLDSIPAAHSLVVADMDLDGSDDVLTGVNRSRAINIMEELALELDLKDFPVYLLRNTGDQWKTEIINSQGVYNLLAGDLEGDGDIDLIRLSTHDGNDMHVLVNQLR